MKFEFEGRTYLTDNDLQVVSLGVYPRIDLNFNPKMKLLKNIFISRFERNFLGGDEIVAYSQALVSRGMDFNAISEAILKDIDSGEDLKKVIFRKTSTGIGRGHSLGGLAGIVLGLHGTKMLDSGLTGFCMSRSLATSSRRRETTSEEIVVPTCLIQREQLLREYLEISGEVFKEAERFKAEIGKLSGVETFNKVIPYNNPVDLFIVLPLDTLVSLTHEVERDKKNPNGQFLPRELHTLADMLENITEKAGFGTMYRQRVRVPRDTYLHYTVFTDPYWVNLAFGLKGDTAPRIVEVSKNFTWGFYAQLEDLQKMRKEAMTEKNSEDLVKKAMDYIFTMNRFVNGYNEALRVQIADSLSWRVWSEQKRHATLRQNVESVYLGAERAYQVILQLWEDIKRIHSSEDKELPQEILKKLEEVIVIDGRLKKRPELLESYVYHTARQLMFYGKMIENRIERRDALFIVPKNIRLRTTETYDLINLIDLEFPLRLCKTCEPERYAKSWEKRKIIAEAVPELKDFLEPKCSVGFCTEGKSCGYIETLREYDDNLHKAVKEAMLSPARRDN